MRLGCILFVLYSFCCGAVQNDKQRPVVDWMQRTDIVFPSRPSERAMLCYDSYYYLWKDKVERRKDALFIQTKADRSVYNIVKFLIFSSMDLFSTEECDQSCAHDLLVRATACIFLDNWQQYANLSMEVREYAYEKHVIDHINENELIKRHLKKAGISTDNPDAYVDDHLDEFARADHVAMFRMLFVVYTLYPDSYADCDRVYQKIILSSQQLKDYMGALERAVADLNKHSAQ